MSLFTPEQFDSLRSQAVEREGWEKNFSIAPASRSERRRGARYYRLTKFNGHRFSYRVSHKIDDNTTLPFIAKCLANGILKLDMSARMRAKKPSAVDIELQALIDSVK
jgi:hypothetical protein